LAVLEYTVNYRRRGWVPSTVLGRAIIPAKVRFEAIPINELPADWFAADPPPGLKVLGDGWLARAATAVLRVPSAIVTEEWNYLLNPFHADFKKLRMSPPQPFNFDQRVARSRGR
jgi:hypothetical protein